MENQNTNEEKLNSQKNPKPSPAVVGGVIAPEICNCGNYTPQSTSGVIDSTCSNCGGAKENGNLQ